MSIKNHKDFWAGLMFLVVGIAFAWGATNYSFGSSARPGPGYFPFGLGLLLAVLGAVEVLKALAIDTGDDNAIGAFAWRPLLTVTGAVLIFGFTLPTLGMAIALPLLVIVSSFAGDEFNWKEVIADAAILTIGSWAVFDWGLNLVIPIWPTFLGQ
ncbi:tripartite tricarboxylate transporter TctB family protein [Aquincola agrisoli]|uniref:tripartite tricarboxylate transporter TctB family protein n=1 Tax=Aquincola TaxID=391952 RepID=UPI002FBD6654